MNGRATPAELRVVVVCMGNICRSPMAEAVLRRQLEAAGLGERVVVDSAGTYGGHAGDRPDRRGQAAARRRGYDMAGQRARGLSPEDAEADLVLAMDRGNLRRVRQVVGEHPGVHLFMAAVDGAPAAEVPDPYYGGEDGFEHVLDLIETGAAAWVERLRALLEDEKAPPAGSGT